MLERVFSFRPWAADPGPRRRSIYDSYTAFHHYRAMGSGGLVAGVFLLNEYVATKGLLATQWHVLALLMAPALAQFVAVVWNPADPKRLLGKRPFRALGMPSRALLLLLLIPAFHSPTAFVAVLAVTLAADSLLVPVQNATLARNYARETRGERFGRAAAVQGLAIMAVTLPAAYLLDHFPKAWPYLYAGAALAGIHGYRHWSRLRRRRPGRPTGGLIDHRSPWSALVHDKQFLAFEACFMVYGLGFLMLQPVLPFYLVHELHVTYSEVGFARGFIFWAAMIAMGPVVGRLSDRLGILEVGACSYLMLAAFPLMLLLTVGEGWGLNAAYGAYGLAMAGINVCWNLGPIVLARDRDPLPYLNAHVALVGVRALIGMPVGAWIQAVAGARAVFWCVVAIEVLAAAGMLAVVRHWRKGPGPAKAS